MSNIISLQNYFMDNSDSIVDNSQSLIIIDNCRNNLDFIKDLKFQDSGVYQFNNLKARFKMKVDMLYSDPSTTTIDNLSVLNNVVNNAVNNAVNNENISRNEDFIITSLNDNIHIVTNEDKKIQLWGNVIINDKLRVYNDVSINSTTDISKLIVHNDLIGLGDVNFNKIVSQDASINNTLEISNNLIVLGDASINNVLEVSNNLYVKGKTQIAGILVVTDSTTLQNLSAGPTDISSTLIVAGPTTLQNTLNVSSKTILQDLSAITTDISNLNIKNNLNISNLKDDKDNNINPLDLKFLKIDISTNNIVSGDISLGDLTNSFVPIVNNINQIAGLDLSENYITISNELLVTSDTSFNTNVTISNDLVIYNDTKIYNRLLFF
jgi:hypothetical protein